MNKTSFEKGVEKGFELGCRQVVLELLEYRFGPLSAAVLARIDQLPAEKLEPLLKAAVKAESLSELGLTD
jgi:hypothetical protein